MPNLDKNQEKETNQSGGVSMKKEIKILKSAYYDESQYAVLLKHKDSLAAINEAIKALENAKEENRWIPCSERLPPIGQPVQVTIKRQNQYRVTLRTLTTKSGWSRDTTDIIAWRPLPKPYKEK